MINNESKISLTFTEGGETLVRKGRYQTAKVNVLNPFKDNEVYKLIEPMKVIQPAVYTTSQRSVTLSNEFIQMALEQPKLPEDTNYHWWIRTPLGKASLVWKKMSKEQKIEFHVALYVQSQNGSDYSYEII